MVPEGIIHHLKSAKDHNKIVAISTDPSSPSLCSAGYVRAVTKDEVQLHSLTKYGDDSGIEVISTEDIVMVQIDGEYERTLELLSQVHPPFEPAVGVSLQDGVSLIESSLRAARENHLIVSLYAEDEEVLTGGWVLEVDSTSVTLTQLSDYGYDDGTVVVRIKDIRSMTCNSRSDQVLAFLHDKRGGSHRSTSDST